MELLTTSNGGPNLVPKKNTTSLVWSYFGLQANDQGDPIDKNTAICQICFTSVPVKEGTTSNIHSHLRNHHSKEFAIFKQATAASGQEKYERSPRADPSSDPLQWWKLNSNQYSVLSQVAKKYLCICASSSASECVFSTLGHIVSK